jgi:Na+/H+ antiporter NhaD/arsenite permease-like protein
LLAVAVLAAVLANLVDNLPAILLLLPAVAGRPGVVLAALVGVNVGPRLGPHSLGPVTRFVVDHAPCAVLLAWPALAPGVASIPPPPPDVG